MAQSSAETTLSTRYYFVDEAGDGTLFRRRGRVNIGQDGCSNFFILGCVDIPNPEQIGGELDALRHSLLADPYFKNVPSMQLERRKTARCFHAKDDIPEVRREVYRLLHAYANDIRFFAAVRDKWELLAYVTQRNEQEDTYRYNPNELYDFMVGRLFKNMLHKDDLYQIYFAKRGHSDRTLALQTALEIARQSFNKRWDKTSNAQIRVLPSEPYETTCLQVADYFLWALQRLYERGEDRYVTYLQPAFRYIHDIDDKKVARSGVHYTRKKPLSRAAVINRLYLPE